MYSDVTEEVFNAMTELLDADLVSELVSFW